MITKRHTAVPPVQYIDDELRRSGRCVVRLPNTAIEFEITYRGVEVVFDGSRYVMMCDRDIRYDRMEFYVKIHNRWDCRAMQEGIGSVSHFEVIDKAGDPLEAEDTDWVRGAQYYPDHLVPTNEKRKKQVLLLC